MWLSLFSSLTLSRFECARYPSQYPDVYFAGGMSGLCAKLAQLWARDQGYAGSQECRLYDLPKRFRSGSFRTYLPTNALPSLRPPPGKKPRRPATSAKSRPSSGNQKLPETSRTDKRKGSAGGEPAPKRAKLKGEKGVAAHKQKQRHHSRSPICPVAMEALLGLSHGPERKEKRSADSHPRIFSGRTGIWPQPSLMCVCVSHHCMGTGLFRCVVKQVAGFKLFSEQLLNKYCSSRVWLHFRIPARLFFLGPEFREYG